VIFYGAIADRIDGGKGYFITTNVFTLEAENLQLINQLSW
jgi:hypothetical protein